MTENLENKETVNNAEVEVKADEPKTFTQAEVDKIVQGVRHKEKKKYQAKIDELNEDLKYSDAQLKDARLVQNVLNEGGGISGSLSDVAKQLAEQYGVSDDNMNRLRNNASTNSREAQKNTAFITAQRKIAELSVEELKDVVNEIEKKPTSERSLEERMLLRQAENVIPKSLSDEEVENLKNADRKFIEEKYEGVNFDELLKNDEFIDFIQGMNVTVRQGMEKFIKLKGKDNLITKEGNTSVPPSTGSVKDSGTSKLKEFYSPEDVDNLSSEDLDDPVIFERVKKSMTKW